MTFLPIVERELRTAARRPATYWLRCFAAMAAIGVTLVSFAGLNSHMTSAMVAKETFGILCWLLMVFCLFAGMFQTADCLSCEKREGTLGLLFLTDLKGYDVVFGKLAANSLHSVYGLLSVLPILAIPLLAGGVSAGEFWRVVVVMLTGLFLSLGVGMFVSALTRETRSALGASMLFIIFVTGILPAINATLWQFLKITFPRLLLWPSLGYALSRTGDSFYNYRAGPYFFWGSILTIGGLGLAGLLGAMLILPRAWQEKSEAQEKSGRTSRLRRMRFGTEQRRRALRVLLDLNPFYWLASRDRLSREVFWMVAIVVLSLWSLFLHAVFESNGFSWMGPFQMLVALSCGLAFIFKAVAASEASRRLSDDHKSGALELMLVTPLSEADIIRGQRRALWKLFFLPLMMIEFLFAVVWAVYLFREPRMADDGLFGVMMFGNMLVLLTDFNAMGWLGMWLGLRARYHHRAVVGTLLRILVIPWLLYFLLGVAGFFNGQSGVPFFVIWFGLCVLNDAIWATLARKGLKRDFRRIAAGISGKVRKAIPLNPSHSQP